METMASMAYSKYCYSFTRKSFLSCQYCAVCEDRLLCCNATAPRYREQCVVRVRVKLRGWLLAGWWAETCSELLGGRSDWTEVVLSAGPGTPASHRQKGLIVCVFVCVCWEGENAPNPTHERALAKSMTNPSMGEELLSPFLSAQPRMFTLY